VLEQLSVSPSLPSSQGTQNPKNTSLEGGEGGGRGVQNWPAPPGTPGTPPGGPWAKLHTGSRKIFTKKTVIPKIVFKKFNEIDFRQEEPY